MKVPSRVLAVLLLFVGAGVQAQTGFVKSHLEPAQQSANGAAVPLAAQQITQSVDPYTLETSSIACASEGVTRDTGWWRLFDLDSEFGLVGAFCVSSVRYGIELAEGPTQNITVNVFCLDDGDPFELDSLELVGTSTVAQSDSVFEFFNVEVGGCCDTATQRMAVELLSDDCVETGSCTSLFIGMNYLGETAPTYASAPDCGIVDPVDLTVVEFSPDLVMVVYGYDSAGGVPASAPAGMLLLILALLGASGRWLFGRPPARASAWRPSCSRWSRR